jgi:hypothetical protein
MSTPRSSAIVWALLASLVTSTACTPAFVATRPYPAPDATALLGALRARQAAVHGAELETRTTSWLQGQRTRATVYMLVDRIGRLRFEAEVALQGTVATLITDGQTFSLADFQNHVGKRGPACPENVASLIPVPLMPAQIAAVLLGDLPLSPAARVVKVTWDGKAAADVAELEDRDARGAVTHLFATVRPAGAGLEILALEGETPGQSARWRVAFDELKDEGGQKLPQLIRFAEPGRTFEDGVEIKVKERKLNPTFRPVAFTPVPPEGFPVETMSCGRPAPRP